MQGGGPHSRRTGSRHVKGARGATGGIGGAQGGNGGNEAQRQVAKPRGVTKPKPKMKAKQKKHLAAAAARSGGGIREPEGQASQAIAPSQGGGIAGLSVFDRLRQLTQPAPGSTGDSAPGAGSTGGASSIAGRNGGAGGATMGRAGAGADTALLAAAAAAAAARGRDGPQQDEVSEQIDEGSDYSDGNVGGMDPDAVPCTVGRDKAGDHALATRHQVKFDSQETRGLKVYMMTWKAA